ncbi:DUF4058 family protein [Leptolyngbya sp. NK1-12]|uniref:DUF4058 family protein n=1 Tax=Leptolyngbya sp. NK1-12 TaxID=2547451 RepID=A0AA96WQN1_9CYAN|nr:DUF4058 family protein [Leptolyngbya sp. NK1-12]
MPSPFPGMDPYLEGYLWPDVHNALANKIRQQLVPLLRPRYTARLEIYLVEDTAPEEEVGILYPDVELLKRGSSKQSSLPIAEVTATDGRAVQLTPAPLTLPVLSPIEVRIATVEIRDTVNNTLVTCIEILSLNKREPGLTAYRQKRQRLYQSNVHLVEIDLLRRGTRSFNHPRLPDTAYLVTVTRAQLGVIEIWPINLQDSLPTVPVPLRSPDADVPLALSEAVAVIYDEAAYDLSIDYRQPPPKPALTEADSAWMNALLAPLRTEP